MLQYRFLRRKQAYCLCFFRVFMNRVILYRFSQLKLIPAAYRINAQYVILSYFVAGKIYTTMDYPAHKPAASLVRYLYNRETSNCIVDQHIFFRIPLLSKAKTYLYRKPHLICNIKSAGTLPSASCCNLIIAGALA